MDLTCQPRPRPDYRLEEMDGELLLYHPSRTTILYCNPTASLIWQLCDGQRTVEEIATLLAAAYEQPFETICGQVVATLKQFRQVGALEVAGASSG